MLKKLLVALSLLATPAFAQSVQQFSTVTRGHVPMWSSSGVIADGGGAADSPISTMGVTSNSGAGFCVSSDRASAAGRNQLCLGAQTAGPGIISLQNYGTAAAQSLLFNINGTTQGFPTVASLPVVANNSVCFSNTTGGLKDCGSSPSTVPLTIGTTPVNNGTTNGLLYDNAGLLGNLASAASGVLVTSAGSVPSISTTLPNGLALGTPTSGTLTNATGLPVSTGVSGLGTGVATALGNATNGSSGLVGFSGALGTPTSGVATNLTGTAAGLTAGTVTTNANLTGDVTSSGNATTYNNVVPASKGGAVATAPTTSTATSSGTATGTGGFVSGTYTTPANVRWIEVCLEGGGGGGGGGATGTTLDGGGGGGAGGNLCAIINAPSATYGYSVGSGGSGGGSGTTGSNGVSGSATTFGSSLLTGNGGALGIGAGATDIGGAGGAGGTATGGYLNVTGSGGGTGGFGVSGVIGGVAGNGGAGRNGGAGTSPGQSQAGGAGTSGGGGAGGSQSGAGGAGGVGWITVIEHYNY